MYVRKAVGELTADEYKRCYRLNMRDGGQMQRTLVRLRKMNTPNSYVHMLTENGMLVGWVLEFQRYRRPYAYFYVRKSHRRRGIGKMLASHLSANTNVIPWDNTSYAFFSTQHHLKKRELFI